MNQADEIRKAVEGAEPATHCADCGKALALRRGRRKGKWFWKHANVSQCPNDQIGQSIMFDSREEAMQAEEVFK